MCAVTTTLWRAVITESRAAATPLSKEPALKTVNVLIFHKDGKQADVMVHASNLTLERKR